MYEVFGQAHLGGHAHDRVAVPLAGTAKRGKRPHRDLLGKRVPIGRKALLAQKWRQTIGADLALQRAPALLADEVFLHLERGVLRGFPVDERLELGRGQRQNVVGGHELWGGDTYLCPHMTMDSQRHAGNLSQVHRHGVESSLTPVLTPPPLFSRLRTEYEHGEYAGQAMAQHATYWRYTDAHDGHLGEIGWCGRVLARAH